MPGAGVLSKVTSDEDVKAKEKRDLTADTDDAAKGSKDRIAKEKPLDPTPRKGDKSKQAREDDNSGQKGSAPSDQAEVEVEPEAELVHQGSMPVNMEMLGKVQQVLNDQAQELRNELREARVIAVEQKKTTDEHAERTEDLQRVTNSNMVTAREDEERRNSKMYDIMGMPKAATHEEIETIIEYILTQCGMTLKSCSNIEILDTGRGRTVTEEIWRLHFKDFAKKQTISNYMRSQRRMQQWPRTLCFYGADNTWWTSFEIWGRWTEGPIVRLVRECINIVWKTLRETWGTKELFSETGLEIDYRLGGIFVKTDGSPWFTSVYDETNTDPKMKIYSKAPDDYEQGNFEQEIENRFMEEEMRRNGGRESRARPEGKGKAPPVAPHILGYKKLPYRRSYKHIRSLHDDHNEHFLAPIAHAVQKMEWRANRGEAKGKKGDGKGEGGKGEGTCGGKEAAAGAGAAPAACTAC